MVPKVTEEYREERRALILEGALRCFAEKGYEATTINDIVRYLQLSKGAIYTYFSSKEEIYIQLMEERFRLALTEMEEQFQTMKRAEEKLRFLFKQFHQLTFNFIIQLSKVHFEFWLYSSRREDLKRLMQERYEASLSLVHRVIEEGKQNGEFRSDINERVVSALFWVLRDGIALHVTVVDDETAYNRIWQGAEEMIFHYLLNN